MSLYRTERVDDDVAIVIDESNSVSAIITPFGIICENKSNSKKKLTYRRIHVDGENMFISDIDGKIIATLDPNGITIKGDYKEKSILWKDFPKPYDIRYSVNRSGKNIFWIATK